MKEIITDGKLDPNVYEIKCSKCGCVFKYDGEEIIDADISVRHDHVECPCCGRALCHSRVAAKGAWQGDGQ